MGRMEDRASGETLKSRATGPKPKTICVVARRSRDPEVIGSLRDRDTETCRQDDTATARTKAGMQEERMAYTDILYSVDDFVATITLNRPDKSASGPIWPATAAAAPPLEPPGV